MACRYVVKQGEDEEATGVPGAPSEQATRWVVGRNETEARAEAEKKCASPSMPHCFARFSASHQCTQRLATVYSPEIWKPATEYLLLTVMALRSMNATPCVYLCFE